MFAHAKLLQPLPDWQKTFTAQRLMELTGLFPTALRSSSWSLIFVVLNAAFSGPRWKLHDNNMTG
jgi:hypothetical protein